MQLPDQACCKVHRVIAWQWSIWYAGEHMHEPFRRVCTREYAQSGCLLPWINTRSREHRKHGQMHSVRIVSDRSKQEVVQI